MNQKKDSNGTILFLFSQWVLTTKRLPSSRIFFHVKNSKFHFSPIFHPRFLALRIFEHFILIIT